MLERHLRVKGRPKITVENDEIDKEKNAAMLKLETQDTEWRREVMLGQVSCPVE